MQEEIFGQLCVVFWGRFALLVLPGSPNEGVQPKSECRAGFVSLAVPCRALEQGWLPSPGHTCPGSACSNSPALTPLCSEVVAFKSKKQKDVLGWGGRFVCGQKKALANSKNGCFPNKGQKHLEMIYA